MRIYNINNKAIKVDNFKIDYSDGRKCTDKNGSFCQDSCGRCPSNKYFIDFKNNEVVLEEDDFVILTENNIKLPLNKELFDIFLKDLNFNEIEEKIKFELDKKYEINSKEMLGDYIEFLIEEIYIDVEKIEIKGFEEKENIFNESINKVKLEILTTNTSMTNIKRILKFVSYITKYTNLSISEDNVNIKNI